MSLYDGGAIGPGYDWEYFGSSTPPDPQNPFALPQIFVKKSWLWVKGVSPHLTFGTTTCARQCYMVAQGPGIGSAPSEASKRLIFGAPK